MKLNDSLKYDKSYYCDNGRSLFTRPDFQSIIDCMLQLKKENEELKQQIIELKRCDRCIHDAGFDNECKYFQDNTCTENKEKWELAE